MIQLNDELFLRQSPVSGYIWITYADGDGLNISQSIVDKGRELARKRGLILITRTSLAELTPLGEAMLKLTQ